MTTRTTGTREEWLAARLALINPEKEQPVAHSAAAAEPMCRLTRVIGIRSGAHHD
jgi:predicted dithiol-disulfide oxidoreductase (DUF899 family)